MNWVEAATRPVYLSDNFPPKRFPTTIPNPANTINRVMLSVENPETFVRRGFM